jgi:DNA mismatch endonuclease (patch repair protein)
MDKIDAARRSENMRRIRGKDTRPELAVRRALHASGKRFRLHCADLPGRPDVILPRYGLALFIHGCFWHRHEGCPNCTSPKTRPEFWAEKFAANVERDARAERNLKDLGWRVETVWECEACDASALESRLRAIFSPVEP